MVLTIPDLNDGEKPDRFYEGMKPQVKLEVLRAGPVNIDYFARIALNVDSALFGAGFFSRSFQCAGPPPMDIGNAQGNSRNRVSSFKGN